MVTRRPRRTAAPNKETLGFQAEVRQLLHLMIHSLYSNPEIFLRELISNGSDAADKLRYEALDRPELLRERHGPRHPRGVRQGARTITVSDNGIGMSHDEVITHIGTIAKSGTREFFASLSGDQAKDAKMIGQFGVGFYSSFIVADRVTLTTRRAGLPASDGIRWESAGEGDYTIERCTRPQRGTEIVLHLRDGHDDLLSRWRLAAIVRKYSDHIALPILMRKEVWDEEKKAYRAADEDETVNQASALWARPKAGHHGRAVRGVLQACRARQRSAARARACEGRGPDRIHAAPLRPGACAVRPVGPRPSARPQALRAARLHHG